MKQTPSSTWVPSIRYLPALLPILCLTLKIKYSLLLSTAISVVSRNLGRYGSNALGFWEKLSFFRTDVVLGFLVIPLCYLAILRVTSRRYRILFITVLNIILFFLLYATWQCYQFTGQYYSMSTLRDSLWWGWHHPEFISHYVSRGGIEEISLAIIFICGVAFWAALQEKKGMKAHEPTRWRYGIIGYLALIVLTISAPSVASSLPSTEFHKSIIIVATDSLLGIRVGEASSMEFSRLNSEELLNRYRDFAHAPQIKKDTRYWAKAQGYNVLFFIFETAPSRVLRIDGDLRDLPVLRRLREQAFIGIEHYTTYPYTNRAWFSIFSSLYPSSLGNNFTDSPGRTFPSMIHSLSNLGYVTKVYYTPNVTDADMFHSLGFQFQYSQKRMLPQELPQDTMRLSTENVQKVRIAEDSTTLHIMESDLEKWLKGKKKFCVAYGPQIGHAPWLKLKERGDQDDLIIRGRDTIKLQDEWLGELVDILQKHGQLNKTIIVVVGDHGVRTKEEDPSFQGGMIDEYSFHVPLLIYAPGVLHSTSEISWVTSHIDISPTVSNLLGINMGRSMQQGSPLWEQRLRDRVTYFFANSYLGADGYTYEGQYYMKNEVINVAYHSSTLHFDLNNLVPNNAAEFKSINETIQNMVALQEALGNKAGE